jgi:GTP-binding protein
VSTGAERVASAADPAGFPRAGLPEVAILGRSNVGKSSLLSRLAGRRRLAFASSKPGTTRLLHFYRIERPGRVLLLVDLPGYGYARVSRSERARWRTLVEGYLGGRGPLRLCVLLQDLRRDVSDDELDLLAWLAERGVPVLVALTKADKLSAGPRRARAAALATAFGLPAERVIATSAKSGEGLDALWRAVDGAVGAAG